MDKLYAVDIKLDNAESFAHLHILQYDWRFMLL
jgi:hypothetical protein